MSSDPLRKNFDGSPTAGIPESEAPKMGLPVPSIGPVSGLYGARNLQEIGQVLNHFGWRPFGPPLPPNDQKN